MPIKIISLSIKLSAVVEQDAEMKEDCTRMKDMLERGLWDAEDYDRTL
jgi:hypothetical protein